MPDYWMYETTGVLAPVIEAYLNRKTLNLEQLAIMRVYLRQWIEPDVWKGDAELARLREDVDKIASNRDVNSWLNRALDMGIDPL